MGLRYRCDGGLRYLIATRESFVPATVGCGAVLRGLRLVMGASEGWGGGVARNISSFSVYVPVADSYFVSDGIGAISTLETIPSPTEN